MKSGGRACVAGCGFSARDGGRLAVKARSSSHFFSLRSLSTMSKIADGSVVDRWCSFRGMLETGGSFSEK